MTEKQINTKLVEDINRILTISDLWDQDTLGERPATCAGREVAIATALNKGLEAELATLIDSVLEACPGKIYKDILPKTYIKYVYTVLSYRLEDPSYAQNNPISLIDAAKANNQLIDYVTMAAKMLESHRSTVTSYRAIELAGTTTKLAELITAELGTPVTVTQEAVTNPVDVYSYKAPYMSHHLWVIYPMLLVTKISLC